jgi:hypothetical protein
MELFWHVDFIYIMCENKVYFFSFILDVQYLSIYCVEWGGMIDE